MKKVLLSIVAALFAMSAFAQAPVKVTEADTTKRVQIGGGLNLIYQGLNQTGVYKNFGDETTPDIQEAQVTDWFRLPAGDLDFRVRIADGVNLHTSVWLASHHHTDTYFGFGYLEVQKFDVLGLGSGATDFLNNHIMIKAGIGNSMFSTNQYYRTTNANAKNNPFISNTLIDDFGTALFGEAYFFANDKESFLMFGLHDFASKFGNSVVPQGQDKGRLPRLSLVGNKVFNFNEDTKLALQAGYVTALEDGTSSQQFKNNRAGSELAQIFNQGDFGGDMGLQQRNENNISVDATFNWKGLQARASYQHLMGEHNLGGWREGDVSQFTFDVTYDISSKVYLAGRFNSVGSKLEVENGEKYEGQKIEIGAGYEMTKGILMKASYFNQDMTNDFVGIENGNVNGLLVGLNLYF
ncbi:hypothetical protein KMW28_04385 [Flammeovirga yaeyamensis]|uniref:Porin n=1 Tax=Flammeovirga yaeyamensis TaxID=367791 RepID=A0AAX1N5P0_9BACT|nr:hypothetical protein [Flammeovirga yaeyamensis]MBB3697394.1 hypothetical protein [Flammeovirga yaeyamensis]NMF36088.1 hypothetical protein [Flammeovirga yaeyamensis]QWG02821.1 hypothetical protein KMW28_04385 [Flammeovirga yaeyamensis]